MKVEEFFSEGFRLAKTEYWTIFFNFLIGTRGDGFSLPPTSLRGLFLAPEVPVESGMPPFGHHK